MKYFLYITLWLLSMFARGHTQAQTIHNVDFTQDGNCVAITYELDSRSTINVSLSEDGGRTYGPPLQRVTGDVGRGVEPGRKRIVWDVLAEMPAGISGDIAFRVKILPDDFTIRVNGVAFDMVFVEGGTFTMGATAEQESDAESSEKPAHRVIVSDFYIGKYEVTQAQWKAIMGSNPSQFKGDDRPVDNVSWDDTQEFLSKLNAQARGKHYRLPTEAEWEYAARGGNKIRGCKYSGSNIVDAVAWYDDNSDTDTHPVGQKLPNELGVYDMSGNVWEWCQDWYGSYSGSPQTNPTGPSTVPSYGSYYVQRGGSFIYPTRCCRVSDRGFNKPNGKSSSFGLRLVCF